MMKNSLMVPVFFFFFFQVSIAQENEFTNLCQSYITGYSSLQIPAIELDYYSNFKNIQHDTDLLKQEKFFTGFSKKIAMQQGAGFKPEEKLRRAQLAYEITLNLERIQLEKKWVKEGRIIPAAGLHSLPDYKEWYSYYIKLFTSCNISPEEVFEMGQSEVKHVQREIRSIQKQMGYINESAFYTFLHTDTFYLADKQAILDRYDQIDKTVRASLSSLYPSDSIPSIGIREWPNSGPNTPPGMYLDRENNKSGKDVFLFNFYNQKHNRRAMEWLYMHEGIPGHHLQFIVRNRQSKSSPFQNNFFYFGNAEGWACYVEDFGKEIGMYKDQYTYLGKWEWDLVRSARLVMEVGIHYYGWSSEKALEYWKENIKGQDEIADREIKRITNWPGQALCYKVGALTLKKILEQKQKEGFSMLQANTYFLSHSDFPLQVLAEAAGKG